MAKNRFEASLILSVLVFVFGVAAFVFGTMDVVEYDITSMTVTGIDAAFGSENSDPNYWVMIAYLLPVGAGVLSLIKALIGDTSKLLSLISVILFVAGIVMLFLVPTFLTRTIIFDSVQESSTMLPGLIMSIVATGLGGLFEVLSLARK